MRILSIITVAICAVGGSSITADAQEIVASSSQNDKLDNVLNAELGAGLEPELLMQIREFVVNPHRFDPYKRVNFQVRWDNQTINGVTYVSPISRNTQVVTHRSGNDSTIRRSAPGLTTISPIVLKRGVTHDEAFEKWSNLVWSPASGPAISLKNYRKDVVINLLNLSGNVAKSYFLYRCWPTKYVPLAVLNADTDLVAEEILTIQCESWERDRSVVEPREN